jgi:hypothetical protein
MKANTCRYCGGRYMVTNFMRRKDLGKDDEGFLLEDTHQAACWKKQTAAKGEQVTDRK